MDFTNNDTHLKNEAPNLHPTQISSDYKSDDENNMVNDVDFSLPLTQVLFAMNEVICNRLDDLEVRVNSVQYYCDSLQSKMEALAEAVDLNNCPEPIIRPDDILSVDMSKSIEEKLHENALVKAFGIDVLGLNAQTNNTDVFPDGSWLGDENTPEARVRCRIPQKDLFFVNSSNSSPEKMALTLLDHLFDEETLASSNLSGVGKHKKKQLDPLMIFGIWCHLQHKFGITLDYWQKIRLNLDSKCRSVHRKRFKQENTKNLKANTQLSTAADQMMHSTCEKSSSNSDSLISDDSSQQMLNNEQCPLAMSIIDDDSFVPTQVLSNQELIEVFEATPEQIEKMREGGIHILLDESPIPNS